MLCHVWRPEAVDGVGGGAAGVGEGRSLPHPDGPKMVIAVLSCPGVGDIMQRHAICN